MLRCNYHKKPVLNSPRHTRTKRVVCTASASMTMIKSKTRHLRNHRVQQHAERNTFPPSMLQNNESPIVMKGTPLLLTAGRSSNGTYALAKGPDGTRGFYSRSRKLNIHAHEFVPKSL